jgi:hypothetical protein
MTPWGQVTMIVLYSASDVSKKISHPSVSLNAENRVELFRVLEKKITLFDEIIFGVENNCRVLAGATAGPAQKRMTKNCLTF